MNQALKSSLLKSARSLWRMFPLFVGTILLVSMISVLIPKSFYVAVFGKNKFLNALIGSAIGSISAGNPITSYIIGGELLKDGVDLFAITAFLVAWVTVGIVQLPAEASILGKKFAILRNISAFVLSLLVAIVTVLFLRII